jgi:hypothetical protein
MEFDATRLCMADRSPVLATKLVWGTANWPGTKKSWSQPLTGVLVVSFGTARPMLINGRLIRSITVGPGVAEIAVLFDSPVPKYRNQASLGFVLSYVGRKWQVKFSPEWKRWLKTNHEPYAAPLNEWMFGPAGMPDLYDSTFPFGEDGLAIAFPHGAYAVDHTDVYTGVFVDAQGRSFVLIMPFANCTSGTKQATGLLLDGIERAALGGDVKIGDWTSAPNLLYLSLAPDTTRTGWHALVYWAPINPKLGRSDHLETRELLECGWNEVVTTLLHAQRSSRGAQPWVPLPTLLPKNVGESAPPLLHFRLAPEGRASTPLEQAYLYPAGNTTFSADFDWQAGAILDRAFAQPSQLAGTKVTLGMSLAQSPPAWSTDAANMLALLDLATQLDRERDPSLLARWSFSIDSAAQDSARPNWLTLGSLEFLLPPPGTVDAQKGSSLVCSLRGRWTKDERDLYPDIKLALRCEVRVSASADAGLRNLSAELDVVNADEQALQRDTEPLRHTLTAEHGRPCQLVIRHIAAPGNNAVVAMEVRSTVRQPMGGDALYFQARPFVFAKVHPVEIDDQAGELIAVWRSDDADGAQWRLPDTTLGFELPPQAVGEEMERGNRFWQDSGEPYINPAVRLKYRFARPTRLVVQPSVLARRYNKNPNNLVDALSGAKVQSFDTEIAYPVQVEFQVSDQAEPDIRIAETTSFLGNPALNLPLLPQTGIDEDETRWAATVLGSEIAAWAVAEVKPGPHWQPFLEDYRRLRAAHSANRASFAARLAQFHFYDPWRPGGGLHLREGLTFRIRSTEQYAPPLRNPLPTRHPVSLADPSAGTTYAPVDLLPKQKASIEKFLANRDWGDDGRDGSLRAGVLHTIEFSSELVSILRMPESNAGSIDALAFSALGATGQFSAAFDEGRATFIVETQHGQLSRLIKVRIGRAALLWNRAKHITVYERTTVPSAQFKDEQATTVRDARGWPILRKTEEYVEPIDLLREFAAEAQKDNNATGFIESSEFVSRRIYVNSAWGRDVVHGYELPLWNRTDSSGFYPKPQLALRMHAGGGNRSRGWLDEPEHIYFYSNTEVGTGADPDRWEAKPEVDCPRGVARLPVVSGAWSRDRTLDAQAMPAPRLGGARRPRFDLATVADGKANLQHGRGETEMLVTLDVVSMARTDEAGATEARQEAGVAALLHSAGLAADFASVEQRVRSLIERLPRQILDSGFDCNAMKTRLKGEINALFDGVENDLNEFKLPLPLPGSDMVHQWGEAAQKDVRNSFGEWEFGAAAAIEQGFAQLQKDVKGLQEAALQAADQAAATELWTVARSRLRTLARDSLAGLDAAADLLNKQAVKLAHVAVATIRVAMDDVEAAANALPSPLTTTSPRLDALAAKLSTLRAAVEQARTVPALAPVVARAGTVLAQATQLVADAKALLNTTRDTLAEAMLSLVGSAPQGSLRRTVESAWSMMDNAERAASCAVAMLGSQIGRWANDADSLLAELEAATDLVALRACLDRWARQVDARLGTAEQSLLRELRNNVRKVSAAVDDAAGDLITQLETLAGSVQRIAETARDGAHYWLDDARQTALALVGPFNCDHLDQLHAELNNAFGAVEAKLRDQVSGALGAIADQATRQRIVDLEKLGSRIGKGIKLGKAIGELPALPTLRFNAERAEYVFDDLKKQINTSPFAARLREIDSGLKELGLAVPTRQLLDQIVPDDLTDIDFTRVFKNLGGIDFQDYFKRFRLPQMSSDKIKITHGLDKATRAAWVKTVVNADFPEEQALFEFSSMAVRVAKMELRATSDLRVSADGEKRAITEGRFTADWGLDFGGTRMATFQDVTVSFDGNGFGFNVSPDKIQLHPSLKFIQEYAKQFQDKLPPAVQLEKDERGIPVGARASFTTLIDNLLPIPPVTIGPILIASGLGLRMDKKGAFEISAHVALGSKTAPVFVQISYLGGGFWLEARCTARGGQVVPQASLGLALGSMRAFNLASVARGSYAILLFAYAEIDGNGGSLRAGMSITGSARILGIANASLELLLEVEHHSGGTTARGHLHVEIEICWCYTLRVDTAAEHKL